MLLVLSNVFELILLTFATKWLQEPNVPRISRRFCAAFCLTAQLFDFAPFYC